MRGFGDPMTEFVQFWNLAPKCAPRDYREQFWSVVGRYTTSLVAVLQLLVTTY